MLKLETVDLKQSVDKLEDGIITLSGPALAISGIIAGIDLVTGGNMLRDYPMLTLAWAICLLLTLDFQVLNLGVRAHRIYISDKSAWRKAGEILIAVIIAGAISYVSIQMQSIIAIANSAAIPVAEAADRLGINLLALTWERSILVLALIFLSGWSRETKSDSSVPSVPSVPPPAQAEQKSSISDETMQLLLAKLATLDELEKRFTALPVLISEVSVPSVPLLETVGTEDEIGGTDEPDLALDERIKALLAIKHDLSVREIAVIVARPTTTVHRTLKRLEQSTKPVEQ